MHVPLEIYSLIVVNWQVSLDLLSLCELIKPKQWTDTFGLSAWRLGVTGSPQGFFIIGVFCYGFCVCKLRYRVT